tara:strand:+ start:1405 stop:1746 length:342 start_codon:yes stop_codon:yes gene_type:complete
MILKYKKVLKCALPKGCEHIENGIIRRDDLMQTDFIPENFNGSYKNFVLRNGHQQWESMHQEAEIRIQNEWLRELGYNPDGFYVDPETFEVKQKDNPQWNIVKEKNNTEVESI